jgi:tetratricopeptide (TPR) repeat protein
MKMSTFKKGFYTLWCIVTIIFILISNNNFAQTKSKGFQILADNPGQSGIVRAVIVGISKYQNIQSLEYADNDALVFRNYLASAAGGNVPLSNIHMLINSQATAQKIYNELDWLVGQSQKGDEAIFYFSGHGDIEEQTLQHFGFLLTYDSPKANYMSHGTLQIIYLKDYLESIASKGCRVMLIADACHAGKLAGGIEGTKETALALQADWDNITKILSCMPGKVSYEDKKWGGGHGVFTYYLLQGLKGLADYDGNKDNKVSQRELLLYLGKNIPAATKDESQVQDPEIRGGNPENILANVNSDTLASLLHEEVKRPPAKLFAMEVKGATSNIADSTTAMLEDRFRKYIRKENLIAMAGEEGYGDNAWEIYIQLKNREGFNTTINSMREDLLSSLLDKASKVVQGELNGTFNYRINYGYVKNAFREVEHAYRLIDSTYIRYKSVKTQYLFLESLCPSFNLEEPIKLIKEAIKIQPDAAYLYNQLGEFYLDAGKYQEAKIAFLKAVNLSPKWPYFQDQIGRLYDKTGNYDSAIVCYNNAINLDENDNQAYFGLGIEYKNLGQYDKSIKYFNKVEATDTSFSRMAFNTYLNLAYVYSLKHDEANCLVYMGKALKFGSLNVNGVNITENKDLDNVRNSSGFKKLIENYSKQNMASAPL